METTNLLLLLGISLLIIGFLLRFLKKSPKLSSPSPSTSAISSKPSAIPLEKKPDFLAEILIFFGSQSGTAAKYSNILSEDALANNFEGKVVDLEEFESYKLQEKTCVFLMATYGEGDPTDNAKMFYKWLKSLPLTKETLKGLKFSVFGLGNSQYQHFNAMGRNVSKLLEDLGGERFYKYGEGDDNSSLEDDFTAWKEGIWQALKAKLSENQENQGKVQEIPKKLQKKEFAPPVAFLEDFQGKSVDFPGYDYKSDGNDYEYQAKKLLEAHAAFVINVKETRQNLNDGSTLHLELDLSQTPIKYRTAQNLAIFPENTPEKVQELAKMLGFQLENLVKLEKFQGNDGSSKKIKLPFPSPLTVGQILTYFCDFQGPIMKKTLKELAQLPISPELQGKFAFLASPEGKLDFKKEIEENKSSLFSLIKQYKIPMNFQTFVSLTPRISPRLFTISSSNLKFPSVVHVTASLVEDALPTGDRKKGLISQYFAEIQQKLAKEPGKTIKTLISFNESQFLLPENRQIPVIMVGPGTGVAPFRAFLQEKEMLLKEKEIKQGDMQMTLFSGCKHANGDYIYREEFRDYQERGVLERYYMAFSRDQANKVYVQHLLKEKHEEIYDLMINRNGVLYLCGSTRMGKDVTENLEGIFIEREKLTKEEAKTRVLELEANKKVIKELWG